MSDKTEVCQTCKGGGRTWHFGISGPAYPETCDECNGTGRVPREPQPVAQESDALTDEELRHAHKRFSSAILLGKPAKNALRAMTELLEIRAGRASAAAELAQLRAQLAASKPSARQQRALNALILWCCEHGIDGEITIYSNRVSVNDVKYPSIITAADALCPKWEEGE